MQIQRKVFYKTQQANYEFGVTVDTAKDLGIDAIPTDKLTAVNKAAGSVVNGLLSAQVKDALSTLDPLQAAAVRVAASASPDDQFTGKKEKMLEVLKAVTAVLEAGKPIIANISMTVSDDKAVMRYFVAG